MYYRHEQSTPHEQIRGICFQTRNSHLRPIPEWFYRLVQLCICYWEISLVYAKNWKVQAIWALETVDPKLIFELKDWTRTVSHQNPERRDSRRGLQLRLDGWMSLEKNMHLFLFQRYFNNFGSIEIIQDIEWGGIATVVGERKPISLYLKDHTRCSVFKSCLKHQKVPLSSPTRKVEPSGENVP